MHATTDPETKSTALHHWQRERFETSSVYVYENTPVGLVGCSSRPLERHERPNDAHPHRMRVGTLVLENRDNRVRDHRRYIYEREGR